MSIASAFSSIGSFIHNEASAIYGKLPDSAKAVIQGEIAKANLKFPSLDGLQKREWVAKEIGSLTGVATGILHAIIHVAFTALESKAPAALAPFEPVIESAATSLVDKGIQTVEAKVETAVAPAPVPQAPATPAPASVGEFQPPQAPSQAAASPSSPAPVTTSPQSPPPASVSSPR